MTQDPKLDPFDLERLVLSQNFAETAGVKKLLTTVPVRKPNAQDFVRTHPSPDYRRDFLMLELKDDREQYLGAARDGGRARRRDGDADPIHRDQSPRRSLPLARHNPSDRRPDQRMVALRT